MSLRPGVGTGPYPERVVPRTDGLDAAVGWVAGRVAPRMRSRTARQRQFLDRVDALGRVLDDLTDDSLRAVVRDLRAALVTRGFDEECLAKSFAVTRLVADRVLGMRPYRAQIAGGWIIAQGMLAEMQTGEGKTLAATLPATAAAMAGVPVHVVTANDYLARRDAAAMEPLYRTLGITVGVAGEGDPPDARRRAYACDVTYCTAKQLAFDYLHDRLVRGGAPSRWQIQLDRLCGGHAVASRLLMRGLCFAIVDEADSVLVDEARTPLILSRTCRPDTEHETFSFAYALSGRLDEGVHYALDPREGRVELTDSGRERLAALAEPMSGVWRASRRREALVHQALVARHLFHRDRDYVVRDGKVVIVDANTGRAMPDRSWEHGLHQIVEVKEGCEPSGRRETVARTTFPRFFRRYLRVGGTSGTLREVAHELDSVYGLKVVPVAPHRPSRRVEMPERVFASLDAKWNAITDRALELRAQGRPVLIGTRTVADSERLSAHLSAAGVEHQVLNARQDSDEAALVARAGEPGRITVATNMAGRGTDIRLAPGVAERGGLHVVVAEPNDARRIDRQLVGRCARQGEPGSHETLVSLEDASVTRRCPALASGLVRLLAHGDGSVPRQAGMALVRHAQRATERRHAAARRAVRRLDEHLAGVLAFAGRAE